MTRLMHRNLRTVPPVVASASGMEIVDTDGKRYLDASGGAAVSCLGHAHPDVLAAIHAQIDRVAYAHTSFFTTEVAEALADTLVAMRRRASSTSISSPAVPRQSRPR